MDRPGRSIGVSAPCPVMVMPASMAR
jgi:hypothetical protein